jgi:TonB family protein
MSARHPDDEGRIPEPRGAALAWDEALARNLVRRAARRSPPGLTGRLEEEWLADLAVRQDALARIRFGLGCCWATRVIARDFGVAAAATAGSVSGQRLLFAREGHGFSRFSRRTTAMVAIVCFHAAIFYVYLASVSQKPVAARSDPMDAGFLTPTKRLLEPVTLPGPTLARPVVTVFPDLKFPLDLPPDPKTITATHSSPLTGPPIPASKPMSVVMGGPGVGFPDTADFYPPVARRLNEAGISVVRVCVDPDGRLTANPTIFQSSGSVRIDEGALSLARAGSGHYRPTTENGRPVSACYAFRIRFQLDDQ